MTKQDKNNREELWSTRFGFYYYNDHEIFDASDRELEAQAKQFADTGINHVMTFSVTHFRWSFQRSWHKIDDALKRIVKAFHKYKIKVTEHHSANLIFAAPADQTAHDIIVARFACRNSKMSNWIGFEQDCDISRAAGTGVSIESLLQVDGETGKPIYLELYNAHYMCPNNPNFVKLYLKYLEEHIYPQGVDGIMTDDISCRCACKYCRELYQQETGFTLPDYGDDWQHWLQNQDRPEYRAWLKFRLHSGNRFHYAVKEHYEQLGLRMLRPNYIATAISFTYLPFLQNFDDLPALDWAFQENNFSDIIRYSWPEWRVEAEHRRMVARNKSIPSMSMFYPERQDTVNFGWSLAMSWGNQYVGTTHNADIDQNQLEKPLRDFEIEHAKLLNETESIAKLGFYDSYDNRIVYKDYNSRSAKLMTGWTQACTHHNIPWTMINKHDLTKLENYSVLVLPEVALLTDEELKYFQHYVRHGGHIIWLGNCAIFDRNAQPRDIQTIAQLIGIDNFKNASQANASNCFKLGKGSLLTMTLNAASLPVEMRKTVHNRWIKGGQEKRLPINGDFFVTAKMKQRQLKIIAMLVNLAPDIQCVKCNNAPEDLLVTAYKTATGELAVHIVNAVDTLTGPVNGSLGHSDLIPMPKFKNEVTITLLDSKAENFKNAILFRPEKPGLKLETKRIDKKIEITLPGSTIDYYALINLS